MSKKYNDSPLFHLMLHEKMNFIKNYLYYATADVLEPKWNEFFDRIVAKAANDTLTIDDALKVKFFGAGSIPLTAKLPFFRNTVYFWTIAQKTVC